MKLTIAAALTVFAFSTQAHAGACTLDANILNKGAGSFEVVKTMVQDQKSRKATNTTKTPRVAPHEKRRAHLKSTCSSGVKRRFTVKYRCLRGDDKVRTAHFPSKTGWTGNKKATIKVNGCKSREYQRITVKNNRHEVPSARHGYPDISHNGRFVVFQSEYPFVSGDKNGKMDIYLSDTKTGKISLISRTPSKKAGNGKSEYAAISGNARYIAFVSEASNLVSGDTNKVRDVFVYDRKTKTTKRASVNSAGKQGDDHSGVASPDVSSKGVVVFGSSARNLEGERDSDICGPGWGAQAGQSCPVRDVFAHDVTSGETTRVSLNPLGEPADASTWATKISDNGQVVAFGTDAHNMGYLDERNVRLYLYNRVTKKTVGIFNSPVRDFDLSADGRFVVFATNLRAVEDDRDADTDIFLYDAQTSTTKEIGKVFKGNSTEPTISADGSLILFKNDKRVVSARPNDSWLDAWEYQYSPGYDILLEHKRNFLRMYAPTRPVISGDGKTFVFGHRTPYAANTKHLPAEENHPGKSLGMDGLYVGPILLQ